MQPIANHRFRQYFNPIHIMLLVIFAVLLMGSTSWAATYYVDKTAGRDSNPGSQSQPWQNCPGMPGWSGNVSLKPGDTVFFDKGDTWDISNGTAFLMVEGGVTYIGNSWGTGTRARFRATGSLGQGGILFREDHPSYETVVKGFNVDMNGKGLQGNGAGISFNWPNSGSLTGAVKRAEDCVVHDILTAGSPVMYGIRVGATGDNATNNVEIIGCEVYNTPTTALAVYAAVTSSNSRINNVTVRGCSVRSAGRAGGNGNAITVKNNVDRATVEYNHCYDNPNGRGINITNTSGIDAPTNVELRYNILENNGYGGIYLFGDRSKSVNIYGNLIFKNRNLGGSPGSGIYFEKTLGGTNSVRILNNTLFQNAAGEIYIAGSSANFSNLEIKNNIMYSLSDKYPLYSAEGRITGHSNNVYYRPGAGNLVKNGSAYYSGSTVKSWEPTALTGDPSFKNTASLPTGFTGAFGVDIRPNSDGLDISTKSPAHDHGIALGAPYDNSINFTGRSSSKWDCGAYEHGSSSSASVLQPPSSLRIIN